MDTMSKIESPSEKPCKVLFVDDEVPVLKALERFARSQKWDAKTVVSGTDALDLMQTEDFDIVVSDMCMPGMDGADFLENVREQHPSAIRILLTGYSDVDKMEKAINKGGIFNYLSKPWDDLLLAEVLNKAHAFRISEKERARLEKLTKQQNRKLGILAMSLDLKVKERTIEIEQALTLLSDLQYRTNKKHLDSLNILHRMITRLDKHWPNKSKVVESYCRTLAEAINLPESEREALRIAARLYRLGELELPQHIQSKALYGLTSEESSQLKKALHNSATLLRSASGLQEVAQIISVLDKPASQLNDDIAAKILRATNDYYDLVHGNLVENIFGHQAALKYLEIHCPDTYNEQVVDALLCLIEHGNKFNIERIIVNLNQLGPGMILTDDFYHPNGSLLLTQGSIIKRQHIENLRAIKQLSADRTWLQVKPVKSLI